MGGKGKVYKVLVRKAKEKTDHSEDRGVDEK
jgi:hypothetical protein